jgi:hypothetical protein
MLPSLPAEQSRHLGPASKPCRLHLAPVALVASATMSEEWQRPQEGEWKQAPDGTWYKDTPPAQPSQPAPQWAPPEGAQPQAQWPPPQGAQPQAQWPPPQGGYVAPTPTSGKATGALILGIAGIFFCPLICAVLALVFGYQARAEIDQSGGRIGGRGQATAGIVLGWVGVGLVILFIGLIVLGIAVGDSSSGGSADFQFN